MILKLLRKLLCQTGTFRAKCRTTDGRVLKLKSSWEGILSEDVATEFVDRVIREAEWEKDVVVDRDSLEFEFVAD
jgi:hypothetical protein